MSKQLYGFTKAETPKDGFVGYAMAFRNDDGSYRLVVRQHAGGVGGESIDIPADKAQEMAQSILDDIKANPPTNAAPSPASESSSES